MKLIITTFLTLMVFSGCVNAEKPKRIIPEYSKWKKMKVSASAYNSLGYQTSGNPTLAAWGDTLKPGMKSIAVSRDLIRMGLNHNTRIKIEGLDGYYRVKDKMNRRWKNKIDIYMGENVEKAREWGKQTVTIYIDTLE